MAERSKSSLWSYILIHRKINEWKHFINTIFILKHTHWILLYRCKDVMEFFSRRFSIIRINFTMLINKISRKNQISLNLFILYFFLTTWGYLRTQLKWSALLHLHLYNFFNNFSIPHRIPNFWNEKILSTRVDAMCLWWKCLHIYLYLYLCPSPILVRLTLIPKYFIENEKFSHSIQHCLSAGSWIVCLKLAQKLFEICREFYRIFDKPIFVAFSN